MCIRDSYDRELARIDGIEPLKVPDNVFCNYYKYVAFLDEGVDRDSFKAKMAEKGVRCGGEVYWPPLHLQPLYRRLLGTKEGDFPKAEGICRRMVCLPIYPAMSDDDARYVVETIREVLEELAKES